MFRSMNWLPEELYWSGNEEKLFGTIEYNRGAVRDDHGHPLSQPTL
jgi:hypothetical protein